MPSQGCLSAVAVLAPVVHEAPLGSPRAQPPSTPRVPVRPPPADPHEKEGPRPGVPAAGLRADAAATVRTGPDPRAGRDAGPRSGQPAGPAAEDRRLAGHRA